MNYNYFIEHRIVTSDHEIDLNINPAYVPFTSEQNIFYTEHPNASYWEVRNCEMNPEPVPPTLEDIKTDAKSYLSNLSLETMRKFVKEYQMENAQSSLYIIGLDPQSETIYDESKASEIMTTYTYIGRDLRNAYKEAENAINNCENVESINTVKNYYESFYNNYEVNN